MAAGSIGSCGGYWSPIVAAGPESALSGVLAGFVFTGIVVILSTNPNSAQSLSEKLRQRAHSLQLFVAAFIVFALDSYFSSITSGELACNRAYAETALSGGILGVGAILLLAGLSWLILTYSDSVREVGQLLAYVTWSVWVVVVLLLAVSAMDVGQAMLPSRDHGFVNVAPWGLEG
jgi:cytochrome bd-type quinol oxidase subunit 2